MILTDIIKGLFGGLQNFTPGAAGDAAVTFGQFARRRELHVVPTAGAGAYTYVVHLPTANRWAGDMVHCALVLPASVNPTIEFRDATVGGTLLSSQTGTGSLLLVSLWFTYDGSAWYLSGLSA